MSKLGKKFLKIYSRQSAYTILELLIVLSVVGTMMGIVVYGVVKFRQTVIVSNTAKEIVIQMRKARRYSINNVVTSDGLNPRGYYFYIDNNTNYYFGECDSGGCTHEEKVKSVELTGVNVSACKVAGGNSYPVIKFNQVTGEFIFVASSASSDIMGATSPSYNETCIIEVEIGGTISSLREIEVSGQNRTIRIK
ncbi:hypothetical protein JW766_02820 [Candidatus Dojkabacteria bacterium]|nr:hypothetical protein [Candidatus Dojkabacteria bacterium]